MEGFINAAKSAYSDYQQGQNQNQDNNQGGYSQSQGGQYGQQNVGNNQAVSGTCFTACASETV